LKAITPSPHIDAEYLLYTLIQYKEAIFRLVGTSAHGTRRIGTSSLQALSLPLPPLEEQYGIAMTLRACDTKITALERETILLDELFQSMLEELMTGRLSAIPLTGSGGNKGE